MKSTTRKIFFLSSLYKFTESSVVSILPFGRSPTNVVSLKLILTLLAAVDVATPRCGFVASSNTFKEAIACNCVAFSSTLPNINENEIKTEFQLFAVAKQFKCEFSKLPSCIGSMV